jgi:hypothetical protein
VFSGTLTIDALLGDVHSLKEKRGVIKPILADLNRRPAVGAAEVDCQDLHRRVVIGVAVVAGSHRRVVELLDDCDARWTGTRRSRCSRCAGAFTVTKMSSRARDEARQE